MTTGTSNSMAQSFSWLDDFLEICEGVYADKANDEEDADTILEGPTCIYCGAVLDEQILITEGGRQAKHTCFACQDKQVTNAHRCQGLVRETMQNVESLFSVSMDIEWDVRIKRNHKKGRQATEAMPWKCFVKIKRVKKRLCQLFAKIKRVKKRLCRLEVKTNVPDGDVRIKRNHKKGRQATEAMPWECFVKIKRVKKCLCRLEVKTNVPDGMVVASVVYFLCVQYLTADSNDSDLNLLQGLAEWFVVNYLRIFDMEGFASYYEQLWSNRKEPENKNAEENRMEGSQNEHALSQYDFWVQRIGKPTARNTVTINAAKPHIPKQQDSKIR